MAVNKGQQVIGSNIDMTQLAARVMLDKKEKVVNSIAMFRPTLSQEPFFRRMSEDGILELLVGGGNRCLAGCQEIYDPVAKASKRVDEIDGEFHVYSRDPRSGNRIIAKASKPFVKGFDRFYEVKLSNGQSMVVTGEHRWLGQGGDWHSCLSLLPSQSQPRFCPVPLASTEGSFLSGFLRDDPHLTKTPEDCQKSYSTCSRPYGEQPRAEEESFLKYPPSQACVQGHSHYSLRMDDLGSKSGYSHPYQYSFRPSILDDPLQILDQSSSCQCQPFSSPCLQPFGCLQDDLLSAGLSIQTHTSALSVEYASQVGFSAREPQGASCTSRLSQHEDLLSRRFQEYEDQELHAGGPSQDSLYRQISLCSPNGVNVIDYTEHSIGPVWDFEVEETGNYECSGIISHNSGKTVSASIAIAAMILNQSVTFNDGTTWNMRPERWRNEPLKCWIVGENWGRIGSTLYRVLFMPDLFRIVYDKAAGQWRSWNPGIAGEVPFENTKPSPPLIKMSDVVEGTMSYENKREKQIKSFDMKNDGTRVEFYASSGSKPMGDPAHVIWVDEKLDDESWYSELLVRLIDRRGRLLWTTYPGVVPSALLIEAQTRCVEQLGKETASSFAFQFKGADNPYTKSKHRDDIMNTMDEDTRRARDEGTLGMERWLVYPRFSKYIHRLWSSNPEEDDELAKACRKCNGIPPDWTRYLILDPGTQNAAVLFVAVPPPKLGDYIVPYDELYLHNVPAKGLAEAVRAKTKGQWFEDFIIDSHAARQTPMGFDGRIGDNYSKEFAACKLRCRRHGSGFSYGSDNVETRILGLQGAMNVRGDGTVRLRIMIDSCKNLVQQLEQYKWGADPKGNPTEKPAKYQKIDLPTALEYLVSRDDCCYIKPPKQTEGAATLTSISAHIASMFSPRKKQDDSIYCGPGAPIR